MKNANKLSSSKNFLAAVLSAIAVMSITVTASAETVETATNNSAQTSISEVKDTVWVGGYECWVVDGHYITLDSDGEYSEVIDLDTIEWTSVEDNNDTASQISLQSNNEVDISGSNTYSGTIDATLNDYETPVCVGWIRPNPNENTNNNARLHYTIRCDDFVFNRQHMAQIRVYHDAIGWGESGFKNLVFSLTIKKFHFVSGMLNDAPTKIQLRFEKGDGNKKVTNYTLYTEVIKIKEN